MLAEWTSAPDPRRYLAALLERPAIDEAIFVASPSLHGSIAAWREKPASAAGRRTEQALVKYIARMAGRATPFGLFSGVSTGSLGRRTELQLAPASEYRRRTRLDNDYLFALADELGHSPEARERLIYRPSTSTYRIAGRVRYAAARLEGKERRYELVSTDPTPYLDATLERARDGARVAELAAPLVGDDITLDEARAYIDELIEAQLLVPDLGIHVTGPEPIDGMIAQLRAAELAHPADVLEAARRAIGEIDAAGAGNPPARYRAIAQGLEGFTTKVDLARLFQVDMVKPGALALGNRVAADALQAIAQLARISRGGEEATLAKFRDAFRARWEDREVPLAEALDEESGIGFESANAPGAEGSPLLAGIGFPAGPGEMSVTLRARDRHLLRRLSAALADGSEELILTDADFDAMKLEKPARLPDAFSTMIQLAASPDELARGELTIALTGASGPSGARLLGRFCHASRELDQLVRDHHALEEARAPHAVFAEVVHLNEGRMGNIQCRPVLRAHELVYLGVSGAPRECQLTLDDLMVSVRRDRIVLRSRRLGREVLPRLSTAHNFRLRSLGPYRFLCALAGQGVDGAGWSWGPLQEAPYLPRVRYGRVVFAPATWMLEERDLEPITRAVRDATKTGAVAGVGAAVQALRAAKRLPRWVVIAAGDNELPIDLDNPMLVAAFADELAGAKAARLHELFCTPDRLVVQGPEGQYANEVVLTFSRSDAPPEASQAAVAPAPSSRRSFRPGSECLYVKIYGGVSTADDVLRATIAPLVAAHGGKWMFIRYADPDPHLRVRWFGDPARLLGETLPALERALEPQIAAGVVRKLMLDTYDRELERYGDRAIELVEQIFWRDSEAILGIVELLDGNAGADARWRLAVRGVDSLLEALGLDAAARTRVVTEGRDSLGAEHHADTAFWGRIGDRFARERASLDLLFARDPARDAGHDLEPGFELLARRDAHIRELAAGLRELDAPIADMAWSIVHMHANRLLHASQRAQELLLYDFLRRLYAARRAREGAK